MGFCFDRSFYFLKQPKAYLPHTQCTESLTKIKQNNTFELIPIKSDGKDSVMNFFYIETAYVIIY